MFWCKIVRKKLLFIFWCLIWPKILVQPKDFLVDQKTSFKLHKMIFSFIYLFFVNYFLNLNLSFSIYSTRPTAFSQALSLSLAIHYLLVSRRSQAAASLHCHKVSANRRRTTPSAAHQLPKVVGLYRPPLSWSVIFYTS